MKLTRWVQSFATAFFLLAGLCFAAPSTFPPPANPDPVQDYQRVLKQLHITILRPPAVNDPSSPYAANYDESKANPYPNLPNPLILNDGRKVTTAKAWWTKRRPQIVEYFDRDIYGYVPSHMPKVTWRVVSTTRDTEGDVPVINKNLVGHVDNSLYPVIGVDIQLSLTTPAHAGGPVPIIMEITGQPSSKPTPPDIPNWQQLLLKKGWGYAVLYATTVQADDAAGLTRGIIGLVDKGQPRNRLDDWGALRAWAWGSSRALDYFETDKSVDAKQVGVEGHSRFGKAALVAMAYDQRFTIGYISSSGAGGAQLYRRNWGERPANLAALREYYWMDENFLRYAGPLTPNDLPVDSHELIALCAPRPVFISGGATKGEPDDRWADPQGMFMAAAAASPVYELLGKKGLGTDTFPPSGTPLIEGDIAFRQHHGGHTPAPNWPIFISFASRYLHASLPSGASPDK